MEKKKHHKNYARYFLGLFPALCIELSHGEMVNKKMQSNMLRYVPYIYLKGKSWERINMKTTNWLTTILPSSKVYAQVLNNDWPNLH